MADGDDIKRANEDLSRLLRSSVFPGAVSGFPKRSVTHQMLSEADPANPEFKWAYLCTAFLNICCPLAPHALFSRSVSCLPSPGRRKAPAAAFPNISVCMLKYSGPNDLLFSIATSHTRSLPHPSPPLPPCALFPSEWTRHTSVWSTRSSHSWRPSLLVAISSSKLLRRVLNRPPHVQKVTNLTIIERHMSHHLFPIQLKLAYRIFKTFVT